MTIHSEHPFRGEDDPVRRLRGRLGGAVSLWTAGAGTARAGLTVSSLMVGAGEPGRVIALLDPDADLRDRLEETGRAAVTLLAAADRTLADAFGGTAPAPGGAFRLAEWEQTPHGPVLPGRTRALVTFAGARPAGWSDLVEATIDEIVIAVADDPLEHRRGRYGDHR